MKYFQKKLMLIFSWVIILSSLASIVITDFWRDLNLMPEYSRKFMGFAVRELSLLLIASVVMWLMVRILMPRIVKPIIKLNEATKELTVGNFDVRVEEEKRADELGELLHNFNIMAKELKSNEYLKTNFVANVSHEFKTPLAVMNGYAGLLAEEKIDDNLRIEYAQMIKNETQRLSKLTENILRLSKLNAQEIKIKKERFELSEQIRRALLTLETGWNDKSLSLDIDMPEAYYVGEENLLYQVWFNIIENAIKFSNNGGRLSIKLKDVPGEVSVTITDTGIGMDEETVREMFEPFYQGDSSHEHEGNGLGMAIVKKIVDLHGGSISAKSAPNMGTKITVTLPK